MADVPGKKTPGIGVQDTHPVQVAAKDRNRHAEPGTATPVSSPGGRVRRLPVAVLCCLRHRGPRRPPQKIRRPLRACRLPRRPRHSCCACPSPRLRRPTYSTTGPSRGDAPPLRRPPAPLLGDVGQPLPAHSGVHAWRRTVLRPTGGVSGVVDGVAACYDGADADEALCSSQQTKPPVQFSALSSSSWLEQAEYRRFSLGPIEQGGT
jgi:hypothetical protein